MMLTLGGPGPILAENAGSEKQPIFRCPHFNDNCRKWTSKRNVILLAFGYIFELFGKVCPRGPRTLKIMKTRCFFEDFLPFSADFLSGFADAQVLQIRRICRYACVADTQILPF